MERLQQKQTATLTGLKTRKKGGAWPTYTDRETEMVEWGGKGYRQKADTKVGIRV